jgi:hypothetical protein
MIQVCSCGANDAGPLQRALAVCSAAFRPPTRMTVAILMLAGCLNVSNSADAQTVINNPIAGPNCSNIAGCIPVDNCREFARDCGQPAADLFCQQHGFRRATSFHVTDTHKTIILSTSEICETQIIQPPQVCGMFDTVTCSNCTVSCQRGGECNADDGCGGGCPGVCENLGGGARPTCKLLGTDPTRYGCVGGRPPPVPPG